MVFQAGSAAPSARAASVTALGDGHQVRLVAHVRRELVVEPSLWM